MKRRQFITLTAGAAAAAWPLAARAQRIDQTMRPPCNVCSAVNLTGSLQIYGVPPTTI